MKLHPCNPLDYTQLDARFRRPLMSYFKRRIGDPVEAEDLTQQVFVRLMTADDLGSIAHAEGYVFTIAANLLKDRGRSARRLNEAGYVVLDALLVEEVAREAMEDRSPERVLLDREALANVLLAIDSLGEKTRDIYILFRLENMKQRDIAKLLGIGQSTVEKHVIKATLHLARLFGPR